MSTAIVASKRSIHWVNVVSSTLMFPHRAIMSFMECFHTYLYKEKDFVKNGNKGGDRQWDQSWEHQNDIWGEVWRTLDRLQFERVFHILWMYAFVAVHDMSYRNTSQLPWALYFSPTPPWPNSPEVSNCLSKFCTNYRNGKGFLQHEYPLRSTEL